MSKEQLPITDAVLPETQEMVYDQRYYTPPINCEISRCDQCLLLPNCTKEVSAQVIIHSKNNPASFDDATAKSTLVNEQEYTPVENAQHSTTSEHAQYSATSEHAQSNATPTSNTSTIGALHINSDSENPTGSDTSSDSESQPEKKTSIPISRERSNALAKSTKSNTPHEDPSNTRDAKPTIKIHKEVTRLVP